MGLHRRFTSRYGNGNAAVFLAAASLNQQLFSSVPSFTQRSSFLRRLLGIAQRLAVSGNDTHFHLQGREFLFLNELHPMEMHSPTHLLRAEQVAEVLHGLQGIAYSCQLRSV